MISRKFISKSQKERKGEEHQKQKKKQKNGRWLGQVLFYRLQQNG